MADLTRAASHPSAKQHLLSCNGFESGFTSSWVANDPRRVVTVRLYSFGSTAGAARHAALDEKSTASALHLPAMTAVDGATASPLTSPAPSPTGTFTSFSFAASGRIVVVAEAFTRDSAAAASSASQDLLHRELDRLRAANVV